MSSPKTDLRLAMRKYLTDIRILIFVFFLLRLYGITDPPLERNHNWRQATTNMYARNFLEVDNNILYGRVDMAGNLSGITAKEFPFFNYLIYLAAEVFGWQHWYGRLINLVVSSFGVWFFYLLVRRFVSPKLGGNFKLPPNLNDEFLAFSATLILLCSIWFGHSRIIMPDTFAVSLCLAGLYFGLSYFYADNLSESLKLSERWVFPPAVNLFLFLALGTLGALCKLPTGFIFSLFLLPLFSKKIAFRRKLPFLAAGAILLTINGWWYFYWLPHLIQTYGYEHYPMRHFWQGAREIFANLPETAERFYISGLKSYVGFGLYLAGVVLIFWKKNRLLIASFLLLSLTFLGYMFKAGSSFYHHNYYIIPFAPVMALLAAYALQHVPESAAKGDFREKKFLKKIFSFSWRRLLLLAIVVEGVANQQDAFRVPKKEWQKLKLEAIADSVSQRNDLLAFHNEEANPQELYFAHRKGWLATQAQLSDPAFRRSVREKGCRFVFVNKAKWSGERLAEEVVFEDENYWVFKLR